MKTRFSLLSVVVCLFTWSSNVAAQSGWPNVGDPSKLKLGVACKVTQVLFGRQTEVFGFLATGIDLSQDDATAKLILERAVDFAVDRCAEPYEFLGRIKVTIRHVDVDPTTISEDKFKGLTYTKLNDLLVREYPLVAVQGLKAQTFSGRSDLQWIEYRNLDRERRNESEKEKERAERAEAERVQQALQAARREAERVQRARQAEQQAEAERLAKQKEQADIAARSAAFVKAYAVTHFVTMAQLAANPFVYQGQVVAVYAPFDQMNSATEGSSCWDRMRCWSRLSPPVDLRRPGAWLCWQAACWANRK